ncbi:DEHA2G22374p [Debaryomyces hansenii CBS767]|uniref:DEHA2G22374p n=1 Tax=Debaryomyces hansenii (strain ATCC 36239 / CBS 767 / BCRC 21394 / JCM 1990 / NBRC 0083 / IGC 2968) TaxID=284592 RepID=B5RUX7_DEBHA|nr:DEHA2G22374p [Debaryomyces hansenii CBS767]CAR66021.1 DEHA2G22374p [Debaryomyces hansenii CBS767]|eukprot:XP_002770698.1 DEHA2G22374p [Debaryomyces hansenii CBS767]
MSSSVTTSSTTTPAYAKRKLELVPFNSQLEIIDKAILNLSKMSSNSNQYINVHRSGYNNNSGNNNPHNHSSNQNSQNKYALAAVAAAAAVQQQQQNYMLQQQSHQQSQQQQYKDINPYVFHAQGMSFNKDQGELSSSSSLMSEKSAPLPYDFQNNFITSNGSNNSVSSPTAGPLNQSPAIDPQNHALQSHLQPQLQNLSQPRMPGFIFDPMASDNSKIKSSSPTSLQSQATASSSKASNNSPPNLFLSTSSSGANAVNSVNSNNPVTTNFLESPSLLSGGKNISSNWPVNSSNTNAINHSSIWGANPSTSSSSMMPSNFANLDSKSESKISIQNNFGGSMW